MDAEQQCWSELLVSITFLCSGRGSLRWKTGFLRTLPRKCGRPKQLISPIKITHATTTSSSSRTTTFSCLSMRYMRKLLLSLTTCLKRTTWRCTWRRSMERQSVWNATENRKQLLLSDEVERKSSIPRGIPCTPRKSDEWKENNRGKQHWDRNYDRNVPETAGRNGKGELMDTLESEEDRRKWSWRKCVKLDETKWRRDVLKNRDNRRTQKIRWENGKLLKENRWEDGKLLKENRWEDGKFLKENRRKDGKV